MGFYTDYLKLLEDEIKMRQKLGQKITNQISMNSDDAINTFDVLHHQMRKSKIIRLSREQAGVFLESSRLEGQDYLRWFKLPFPSIYIDLGPGIIFKNYLGEVDHSESSAENIHKSKFASQDPVVRAALLLEAKGYMFKKLTLNYKDLKLEDVDRVMQVNFLMPLPDYPLNCHVSTLVIFKDGRVDMSHAGFWQTRARMIDWYIHVINFLQSPSVKLVPCQPSLQLNRARLKKGKPPLPGWYEITYRKHTREYTKEKTSERAWEHHFRYDVRGHFKIFKRGIMAGRVIWCPPHQRGVKHELYKPKVYRIGQHESMPDVPYQG